MTAEEFARYVGYYEDGELKDTFFDTFLFSPCSGFAPEEDRITLKGWQFYIDSQFVADRNLDALNTAVGSAADELGLRRLSGEGVPFHSPPQSRDCGRTGQYLRRFGRRRRRRSAQHP